MKKSTFILYVCLFFQLSSFSQKYGRVVYRVNSEKLTQNNSESESRKTFVLLMNNMSVIRDSIQLNLDFKDNASIFYVDTKTNLGLSNLKGYKGIINSFNVFYRNDNTDTLIEVVNSDKIYLVTSKASEISWKITNETKVIGNYKCIKAEGSIKSHSLTKGLHTKMLTAWFCPEIPIKLGPKGYGGLPGLIMELKEGKLTYYVKALNFNLDDVSINKPVKGKVIFKEDFFNLKPTITTDNFKEHIGN
ncbi:GLPGLI family protein [Paucihalobacter ruber]|uniref:GLPGLI family protein n=1 Tax=Paucihalobacter ruber TaxID=2567861 RepID=A0A506PMR8_9FLAO|nr:GLPGLI family protein [Paucihalobacter ruber]TPV34924.1 GLPGLI family protein [Paucihalobacter ruber]